MHDSQSADNSKPRKSAGLILSYRTGGLAGQSADRKTRVQSTRVTAERERALAGTQARSSRATAEPESRERRKPRISTLALRVHGRAFSN